VVDGDLVCFWTGSSWWALPKILVISSEDSEEDVDVEWELSDLMLRGDLSLCLGFFAKTVVVETAFSFR
jgi:hypothetical protein